MTSFVGRLVADLRRRDVVSRVAVVTYTQRAHLALSLSNADVNDLTSLPFSSGHGRNVAGALRLTRTSVSACFELYNSILSRDTYLTECL